MVLTNLMLNKVLIKKMQPNCNLWMWPPGLSAGERLVDANYGQDVLVLEAGDR